MKSFICLLLLASTTSLFAAENKREYLLLKDARERIQFKPLSNEDKALILTHAKILFSKVYVNLEHKMFTYKINPIAKLKEVEARYQEMNEVEFHKNMLDIFSSVNDFHVNYNLPKPYACYASILPVSFQKIEGRKVIVSTVDLDRKTLFPEIVKVSPGDELVSYNHVTPSKAIEGLAFEVGASTPDAVFLQGVYELYFRGHYNRIVRDDDEVAVEFRKPTGEVYSLNLPWMARFNPACLEEKKEEKPASGKFFTNLKEVQLKERRQYFLNIKNKFFSFFKNRFPLKKKSTTNEIQTVSLAELKTTKFPNLSWKAIPFQNQTFGYLKLDSFDASQGVTPIVNEVKTIVSENLNNTPALVIDLRGNYGGIISFAEKMAALFGSMPVKNLPFYVRANDFILTLLNESSSWKDLIMPQVETNSIVGPGELISISELSKVEQAYFGKVVILINSECFSSCDLFAAAMKDYAKVKIYGTDRSTFGGGANVWDSAYLKGTFDSQKIPALPQGISMRMTGRHAHRLSDNTIIEDHGVASDEVLKETVEDALSTNSTVVAKIFKDFLNAPLIKSSDISLKFRNGSLQNHSEATLSLEALASNIDYVSVFKNKKFVDRFEKKADSKVNIVLDMRSSPYGIEPVEIYAFDRSRDTKMPVLRKTILVESLPAFKKIEDVDILRDTVATNFPVNANCGWKKVENSLVLSENYCSETTMEATLATTLSNKSLALSFDLVMDAEPDFDFFEITVISDGVETKLMKPTSTPQNGHFSYDLSAFSGKNIDVKFKFISDEAFSGKGGSISNIQII